MVSPRQQTDDEIQGTNILGFWSARFQSRSCKTSCAITLWLLRRGTNWSASPTPREKSSNSQVVFNKAVWEQQPLTLFPWEDGLKEKTLLSSSRAKIKKKKKTLKELQENAHSSFQLSRAGSRSENPSPRFLMESTVSTPFLSLSSSFSCKMPRLYSESL